MTNEGGDRVMKMFAKLGHALFGRRGRARVVRVEGAEGRGTRIDELPAFTLKTAELMRYDPQVRIGLGARNGLLMAAEVEVSGGEERVVRWVQHQWDALWGAAAHQLLRAKLYGFLPFEVVYRRGAGEFEGLVEVERLIDYHPREARILVAGEKVVGFSREENGTNRADETDGTNGSGGRWVDVFAPKALVCTFDAECGMPYGCALLARAYPAWFEKWMAGGAKRTLRLRMIKDAYVGDILWYPPDQKLVEADGKEISFRDFAQEIVEKRHSGGALTLPLVRDSMGNRLVDYTPPQGVPGYTQIFRWKQDLDLEIWKALEVPPEIIQAQTSGSGFSGRWIPFAVALSAVHQELAELIRCVDRDILRPICAVNFGEGARYEIRPRSLVETYARMFGTKGEFKVSGSKFQVTKGEEKFE
jgi:hypothetical protein